MVSTKNMTSAVDTSRRRRRQATVTSKSARFICYFTAMACWCCCYYMSSCSGGGGGGGMLLGIAVATAAAADDMLSPEALYRETVHLFQTKHARQNDWTIFQDFGTKLWERFDSSADNGKNRLDIVGAIEEGILVIEKIIYEQGQGENRNRDVSLSFLYMIYGKILYSLSKEECYKLAHDPHTLLIGSQEYQQAKLSDNHICIENSENSIRNAISLDATNLHAEEFLKNTILSAASDGDSSSNVHQRKPKEFVAELFDSFADTFDDKLLKGLQYKVPTLVGELAKQLLLVAEEDYLYPAVLDAGCGTGLAGRSLRPLIHPTIGILVGVDASKKMLIKATKCTLSKGCGLPIEEDDSGSSSSSEVLYHRLLQMDLEDMTIDNLLNDDSIENGAVISSTMPVTLSKVQGFNLIAAADVLVYFGDLTNLFQTFANISLSNSKLIVSCELTTLEEAPLGYRLLPSGRFAHSKTHVVDVANKVGYSLIYYKEIVPRMEKGEPVQGHLFGFEFSTTNTDSNAAQKNREEL